VAFSVKTPRYRLQNYEKWRFLLYTVAFFEKKPRYRAHEAALHQRSVYQVVGEIKLDASRSLIPGRRWLSAH